MQTLDVTIDLETYFDAQYSLTKKTITTMDYVRDPRFELQGMSIKIGGSRTRYYDTTEAIQKQIANLKKLQKTHKINLIGQNTKFDALVLNERLGFTPDYYSDTQAMSKGLWPHYPSNLEAIAKRLWPNDKEKHKLDGLTAVKGVRREDFTRAMRHKLGVYCVRDSDITYQAFKIMKQWMPQSELDVINMTVRMFVEPQFVLDTRLMQQVIEQAKTEESVAVKMMQEAHPDYPVTRQTFTSNQQFVNFLKYLGINDSEIPTKISPRTGKVTPALGKNDVPFIKFKNDNIHLAKIFQTREFLKSSISRTRAQKLIQAVEHHPEKKLCVPLAYYQAHTGRYGGNEGLNLQNLQRKSHHRLALTAPEGSFVYVIDSSNIEARMLAWFANEHGLLDQFRNKEDVYSTLASKIYDIEVTKQTHPGERGVGKVACIAEGQRVLTDKGLVPIEKVTTGHKVWDGLGFVSHHGVVDQGVKEVITYDGLTATPDHIVFTTEGRQIPFGEIASSMGWLAVTGYGRHPIRFSEDHICASQTQKRQPKTEMPMHILWGCKMDKHKQPNKWEDQWLPKLFTNTIQTFDNPWSPVRCYSSQSEQGNQPIVPQLRGAWDRESVQEQKRFHTLCGKTFTASKLQRNGNRPDKQQRPLRTGELTTCCASGEYKQPQVYPNDAFSRQNGTDYRATYSIFIQPAVANGGRRLDLGTNDKPGNISSSPKAQKLAKNQTTARVYDILNAGPRHRFTVEGKLVHNCLGLGYQMGAPKFFDTLRSGPMGMDPIDCDFNFAERVVKTFRNTYPNIVRSWKTGQHVITKMTRGGMEEPWGPLMIYERALMLPNGMCLHYPELSVTEIETVTGVNYEYNYKTYDFKSKKFVDRKIYGGKLIENIVQALARIVIIDQMLRIDAMLKEYGGRVVLQVHDEIIAIAPKEKADEIFAKMTAIMSTPPAWCHDLPLDSEGGFDTCYSK